MNLAIEIKSAHDLPRQTKDILHQMYQREFGWDKMIYTESQWFVVGTLNKKLIGHVGILQRKISLAGKLIRVGGIHGVVTEPAYRCRGVASTLMGKAIEYVKDELNLPFALLTCKPRLEAFYNRLGWKTVKGPCVFEQPDGPRSCGGLTMVVKCGEQTWPEGRIDLCGLPW
jgi:predicted acetyltransferase